MIYSKKDFSQDLKAQLDLGYEPKSISDWAHRLYLRHCGRIDTELEEIMMELFTLGEGPEFEVPESQLRDLVAWLEQQ